MGAATLVGRRFGPAAGGVASAFPAIVGPVLLIDLLEHGERFTARAAAGTLVGLTTLAAFAAVYARVARAGTWPLALAAAWVAAGAVGLLVRGVELAPLPAALVAAAASVAAFLAVPPAAAPADRTPSERAAEAAEGRPPGWVGVAGRMLAAAVLVVALAVAASAVGPVAGGVLAALPVLASVLAVFTHRDDGPQAAVALLRGTLTGMGGFVAFCLAVGLLVEHVPPAPAFAAATALALAAQALNHGRPAGRAGRP